MDWKIPPCVSNYKNQKSFLIPLDMRLQMERNNRKEFEINDKFQDYSRALYLEEKKAKHYLQEKRRLQQLHQLEQAKIKERHMDEEFLSLKRQKREEMDRSESDSENEENKKLLKQMIMKKVEREAKIENVLKKKNKHLLEMDRELAEKIALGEEIGAQKKLKLDGRLFKEEGLDSGFRNSEHFKIYDQPLFREKVRTNIYTGVQQYNDIGEEENEEAFLRKKEVFDKRESDKLSLQKPLEFERSKKLN